MLEEMNSIFGVPTRWHIKYQLGVMLPWIKSYFITRSTSDKADTLATWYEDQQEKQYQ